MVSTWKISVSCLHFSPMKILWGIMIYHQILDFSIIKLEIQGILEFIFSENIYWSPTVYLLFWAWGIEELNKILTLRKTGRTTQIKSMILWNSHSHYCLNYNAGGNKLSQITQIIASLVHFTASVDVTSLKHLLGPQIFLWKWIKFVEWRIKKNI